MKIFLLMFLSWSSANAQTPTSTASPGSGTKIGVSAGPAGGSYYDVPTGTALQKYGTERLSPTGLAFTGTLDSDKLGNVYFRKLSVARNEDKTKLGKQTLFLYETPKTTLKEGKYMDVFVKGTLSHYSQKDHFIYFKVDGEHTPTLDKNLQLEEHVRTNQHQTYVAPEIGICKTADKTWKDFQFIGSAMVGLAPAAIADYQTKVTDNKMKSANLDQLDKSGKTFAFGGEIQLEGVAKYKDKYYFKAKLTQTHMQGTNKDKVSTTNRIGHYELGYLINKNLCVNVSAQNNELLFHDKDRHAIDVYNIVGVGLNYTIAKKKK